MTTRLLKEITPPFSETNKRKMRTLFKRELGLPRNASEAVIANTINVSQRLLYNYLAQDYNNYVQNENERILAQRRRQAQERRRQRAEQARQQRNQAGRYYAVKREFKDKQSYNFIDNQATKIKKKDMTEYNTKQGVFIREVKIVYTCRQKADDSTEDEPKWNAPFQAFRSEIVIANSMNELITKSKTKAENLIEGLEQVSPELNSDFNIQYGNVYNSNNRVPITQIKMRNASVFKLDGEELGSWDIGSGRCVYDALISLWEQPNSKMLKKANYEWLNNFFTDEDNTDPENNGISIDELLRLSQEEKFTMYAFNINDKLIVKHMTEQTRQSKKPVLIFRIHNNHMYLIDNKQKQMSLIAQNRNSENIRHNQLENDKKKYVKPDQTQYENVFPDDDIIGNEFATKYIFENKSIPFPFKSNIRYDKGRIKQMQIGNKKIYTEPLEKDIKEYLENNNFEYKGQHYINMLMEFWEETYNDALKDNNLISEMNPNVFNMFSMDNVKNRVHYGNMLSYDSEINIMEEIENDNVFGADIIKCYSSILDNPSDNWLQYTITDEVKDFDGVLKTGLYFVETEDMTILHKTNWYSNTILQYAKENNISFEIIKQYIPASQSENKDYFKKIIDFVIGKCNTKLSKNIINSITGMMGKTKSTSYNAKITTDINEVWDCLTENMEKIYDFFMKQEYYDDEKILYIYGFKKKQSIYTNNLPMYIQILDQSNIKLHQLQKKLGGQLLFRKTDAVIVLGGKNIVESDKTLRENWGKETIIPKEELLMYDYGFHASHDRAVENPFFENTDDWKWNYELTSSSQYKDIIEYAIENKGLLICSRAGTGKSYIIQQAVKDGLIDDDKRCRLAFTNKARRNIHGTTIHSAISINGDTEKASVKMVENYKGKKVIVVDEISMISQKLWSYLILLKRISGATFILLGDYRQLPAVEDKEHNYFDSSIIKFLTNNNRIELLVRQRYDKELWDWLEDFYEKGISGNNLKRIDTVDYNAYNICYYNKTREAVNMKYMNFHKSDDALFLEHKKKDEDDRADSIYIYKNLPVMAIVNKLKQNKKSEKLQALFCNSDTMTVIDFSEDLITMKLDVPDENGNDIVEVKPSEFHKSFVCNYCSTTHKNQGATISQNIQIWDWKKMQEDRRIGYTAVSRGKNVQQIKIVN